jgi:chromosome segregation ATPase
MQEIEQSFRMHEERFKRIEDNLAVQGEILNRIDQRLDRMAARVESHDQQLSLLQSATTSLGSAAKNLISSLETQGQQLTLMQSAMTALFQRMDAFIQGLERGNGDTPQGGLR